MTELYTWKNYVSGKEYTGKNLEALKKRYCNGGTFITLKQYAEILGITMWDESISDVSARKKTYVERKKEVYQSFKYSTKGKWVTLSGGRFTYQVINTEFCKFPENDVNETAHAEAMAVNENKSIDLTLDGKTEHVPLSAIVSQSAQQFKAWLKRIDESLTVETIYEIQEALKDESSKVNSDFASGHISRQESTNENKRLTAMAGYLSEALPF